MEKRNVIATRNVVRRLIEAGSVRQEVVEIRTRGLRPMDESTDAIAQSFPSSDSFYMIQRGERFLCMKRLGSRDIVHASFFSESICRGHMFDRHQIS